MSDPRIASDIISVEIDGGDDAEALESLARWLRQHDRRLSLYGLKIEHEYGDQYTPTTLTAFVMAEHE